MVKHWLVDDQWLIDWLVFWIYSNTACTRIEDSTASRPPGDPVVDSSHQSLKTGDSTIEVCDFVKASDLQGFASDDSK